MVKKLLGVLLSLLFSLTSLYGSSESAAASAPSFEVISKEDIDELELFLKGNSPYEYDKWQINFLYFKKACLGPFKDSIEKSRVMSTAFKSVDNMILIIYGTFNSFLNKQKKDLSDEQMPGVAILFRDAAYLNTPCFDTFQQMLHYVLSHSRAGEEVLKKLSLSSYGIEEGYAWLKDEKNRIVPIPLSSRMKSLEIYYAPFPYGKWTDGLQRQMLFCKGSLITEKGFYIEESQSGIYKFSSCGGILGGFRSFSNTARVYAGHPIVKILELNGALTASQKAFIELPTTNEEERDFEEAFLNELLIDKERTEEEGEEPSFSKDFLSIFAQTATSTIASDSGQLLLMDGRLDEADSAAEVFPEELPTTPMGQLVANYLNSLYAEEQEQVRLLVCADAVPGKLKAFSTPVVKRKKDMSRKVVCGGSTGGSGSSSPEEGTFSKTSQLLAKEVSEKLKVQGRVKWQKVASIITSILKKARTDGTITLATSGSHFVLHTPSSAGPLTIVRPHGSSDTSLPASQVRSLIRNVCALAFQSLGDK